MNELDLHYPPDACPFCNIAAAFPGPVSVSLSASTSTFSASTSTSTSISSPLSESISAAGNDRGKELEAEESETETEGLPSSIPTETSSDPDKTIPSSFIVLASRDVLAFLDILPMTRGHLLVASRQHRVKVADLRGDEGREMGFWLPVLARVVCRITGVEDYNIVQNNGARAAQVVPHVHFHIIPRPETKPEIKSKSWTMFGRGQRDELDDEDGASIAAQMRQALREEVAKVNAALGSKL
ncbi:HIT-like protein [Lophiostoma macrostomum CBS 122681]|uniref:HIT-like protein n=1 Tax=Lophiostoma macrostomum CBS 122681 TaxID=1314788 RepID=A0A6A6SKY3_9PLEO|nr:HIT-like protein [Lophiostoma macrostomum CBS 122681]